MSHRSFFTRIAVFMLALTLPVAAFAGNAVGKPSGGGSYMEWQVNATGHDRVQLTVLDEAGGSFVMDFPAGRNPHFSLSDLGITRDGQYTYELRMFAKISEGVQKQLDKARAEGDDETIKRLTAQHGLGRDTTQYGVITVINGSIVSPDGVEADANDQAAASAESRFGTASTNGLRPTEVKVNDQVIPDDLIVQGSTCTGFDCVDNESFGFDTLRLKENNLRINFDDTSTSTGYPANDWRIIANDSGSGGASYLAVEDSTAARNPFLIEAGSPASAIYVDSSGKIGFRNSAPTLDLHMTTGDTPGVRFEQTNSGGFTAQTWDVAGNEANFFVRDVTGGSRLPFRIRPGAPTSSIDINASGQVGVGTASPKTGWGKLQVYNTDPSMLAMFGTDFVPVGFQHSGANAALYYNAYYDTADKVALGTNYSSAINFNVSTGLLTFRNTSAAGATDAAVTWSDRMVIDRTGRVGIGNTAPTQPLMVGTTGSGTGGNGAYVSAGGTWTNGSSRTFKEHIEELTAEEAIKAVADLKPVRYNYIVEPQEQYVGFIAEDVPELVATTSMDRKYLNPMDIVATLTKVVQEQQKTIEQLSKKVDELAKEK